LHSGSVAAISHVNAQLPKQRKCVAIDNADLSNQLVTLAAFAEPYLLPGESHRHFAAILTKMIDEVRPQSCMEWFWTFDLVELSWEILRYRRLKMRILARLIAALPSKRSCSA
jgi:hypothetical protein